MVKPFSSKAGVAAFADLMKRIHEHNALRFGALQLVNGDTCLDKGGEDPRDYAAIARLIEASIAENITQGARAQREGYLRALADLFSIVVDGFVPDTSSDDWDPLGVTEASFASIRQSRKVEAAHG